MEPDEHNQAVQFQNSSFPDADHETGGVVVPAKVHAFFGALRVHWNPGKLEIPLVAEELTNLPPVGRAAEVIRYSVLRLEHWLSPGGGLREWLRWNVRVAISLSIPAALIVPCVTYLLGAFATWAEMMVRIVKHLLVFPLAVIALVALSSAAAFLTRSIRQQRRG